MSAMAGMFRVLHMFERYDTPPVCYALSFDFRLSFQLVLGCQQPEREYYASCNYEESLQTAHRRANKPAWLLHTNGVVSEDNGEEMRTFALVFRYHFGSEASKGGYSRYRYICISSTIIRLCCMPIPGSSRNNCQRSISVA